MPSSANTGKMRCSGPREISEYSICRSEIVPIEDTVGAIADLVQKGLSNTSAEGDYTEEALLRIVAPVNRQPLRGRD